jgi:CxxC-x17-CxxC domain-containing protein
MAEFRRDRGRKFIRAENKFGEKRTDPPMKRFERRDSVKKFHRSDGPREMHRVICSTCHKECEVPFKPTSSKPVYCEDCFNRAPKNSNNAGKYDLDQINAKLDKIMKALNIN